MSRAKVAVMTHAPSDVTAFLKAAASSILRSLLFQVTAAVVFTPAGEMELLRSGVEKGVKDLFKEEWVDRVLCQFFMTVLVLVVAVVRVTMEGVAEDIPGGAVENFYMILVEEGEDLIILEKISKMIAVITQLVMAG